MNFLTPTKKSASMSSLSLSDRSRLLGALCGTIAFACFATSGVAQTSQDVDRAQLLGNQNQFPTGPQVSVNGVDDGHAAASPNDPDLGVQEILKRQDEYQPFTISFATPIYYTSNVALVNSGERSDVIAAPVIGLSYDPQITKTFYGHLSVQDQLFYYNNYGSFDFGAFDIQAGVTYFLPQFHNLVLHAFYDYNRLTTKDSFDALFENHSLIFNAELPFRIGRAQRVALGTDVNISLAGEPDGARRNEYDAYLGYGVNLTRAFSVDAVGRIMVHDYVEGDRVDVSEILALTASYRLTNWFTASVIGSFAKNQSNHSVFDYNVANVGGAMSFAVKF
jgi:hypothetical protein